MVTRLTPILPVGDVREELTFYLLLGFVQHTDPVETYPVEEFAAVAHGEGILFGLTASEEPDSVPPSDCCGSSRPPISTSPIVPPLPQDSTSHNPSRLNPGDAG